MTSSIIIVRPATRNDCAGIMRLKKELAVHQNMGDLPMLSVEELEHDGFNVSPPCYHCLVAELKENAGVPAEGIVGYALYFYGYAVWEGKVLHLEDLCVSSEVRGKHIGLQLMKKLAIIALDQNCARIQLEVLRDNDVALNFYNKLEGWDTTAVEGWHNFRLEHDALEKLIERNEHN